MSLSWRVEVGAVARLGAGQSDDLGDAERRRAGKETGVGHI